MDSFLKKIFLLVVMAAAIYGIERGVSLIYTDQTLAPVLSILCFAILIFVGSPRLILVAIPLFALESYLLIRGISAYPHIRTISLVLGGLLAYWACRQKVILEARISEMDIILSKIQTPWILCDRSGSIRRMSTPAAQLARANFKDLEGSSFFSKFSGGPSKGELIQKFLKAADSRIAVDRVGLNVVNQPGSYTDASFIPIQTKEGTGILVILSPQSPS